MELKIDYNGLFSKLNNMRKSLSKINERKKNDDYYTFKVEKSGGNCDNGKSKSKRKKIDLRFANAANEKEGSIKSKRKKVKDVRGTEENNAGGKMERTKSGMSFGDVITSDGSDSRRRSNYAEVRDEGVLEEEDFSLVKRKDFMLRWIANAAKNPTDPMIGKIPPSSRWEFYGSEHCWKQVLLVREAMYAKKDHFVSIEESIRQEKRKDDQPIATGEPRSTARGLFEKTTKEPFSSPSSMGTPREDDANRGRRTQRLDVRLDLKPTSLIYTGRPLQRIPIGQHFQVEVPEWTGISTKSDDKWLGTQVWPLEKNEPRLLIERDPIGKGRLDTCGCQFPGSIACVKFHVSQRRMKLKVELGSAFYAWKFDNMGEDCSVSWSVQEEKKFNAAVTNPMAFHESFWLQLYKVLPLKNWVDQVNYYFNVFVLRRRASQNRCIPDNVDSEDETDFRGSPYVFKSPNQ